MSAAQHGPADVLCVRFLLPPGDETPLPRLLGLLAGISPADTATRQLTFDPLAA
ncbi:hypothetical protein [Streptomyces sp. NPDC046939]|uniref:hypothetical protein n=1 Tax=Streptomyces sp. NPDC046939 TaxID=3155376 RepID=UPI0033D6C89C